MTEWWQTFFDADYIRLWEGAEASGTAEKQADGLWSLLGLGPDSRVLDAPCGYGRISIALARRGASILGVDFSEVALEEAERRRGDVSADRLRYRRHDLREPLDESGFDVALNLFSSLGYGEESEDVAILSTLRAAVRPGGIVFIETMHRDRAIASLATGRPTSNRLPDGTLTHEVLRFDPMTGYVNTTWYWSGPAGDGEKHARFRVYSATELVRVVEAAGLRFRSAHRGCFPEPFATEESPIGGRLGILAVRD